MTAEAIERRIGRIADMAVADLRDLYAALDELKSMTESEIESRENGTRAWTICDYRHASMADLASWNEQERFGQWAMKQSPMIAPAEAWIVYKDANPTWKTSKQEPECHIFKSRKGAKTIAEMHFHRRIQEAANA